MFSVNVTGFTPSFTFPTNGNALTAQDMLLGEDRFVLSVAGPDSSGGTRSKGPKRHSALFHPQGPGQVLAQSSAKPGPADSMAETQKMRVLDGSAMESLDDVELETVQAIPEEEAACTPEEFLAHIENMILEVNEPKRAGVDAVAVFNQELVSMGIEGLYGLLWATRHGQYRPFARVALNHVTPETVITILNEKVEASKTEGSPTKPVYKNAGERLGLAFFFYNLAKEQGSPRKQSLAQTFEQVLELSQRKHRSRLDIMEEYYFDLLKEVVPGYIDADNLQRVVNAAWEKHSSESKLAFDLLVEKLKTRPDVFGLILVLALRYGSERAWETIHDIANFTGMRAEYDALDRLMRDPQEYTQALETRRQVYNQKIEYMNRFYVRAAYIIGLFG